MPSLSTYKRSLQYPNEGRARKLQSDQIMEATWDRDISSKIGYFYDYYHDDEPLLYTGLHSDKSKTKFPIKVKVFANAYNSENKDQVGYHLQFQPSFDWRDYDELEYYQEYFVDKYEAQWPIGEFVDLYDEQSKSYRKWLITESANWLGNQFPTWYILPCDYLFQWVADGKLYQHCGVSRSQSS